MTNFYFRIGDKIIPPEKERFKNNADYDETASVYLKTLMTNLNTDTSSGSCSTLAQWKNEPYYSYSIPHIGALPDSQMMCYLTFEGVSNDIGTMTNHIVEETIQYININYNESSVGLVLVDY
jgi:hypothetical protein